MKKNKLPLLLVLSLFIHTCLQAQVKIAPTIYGENLWFSNFNPSNSGGVQSLGTTKWNSVTQSGAKLIRIGGNAYNNASKGYDAKPQNPIYYVSMVDSVRIHGCEPVITIPHDAANPTTSINNAKEIIRLVNIVHKRNVRYVCIGNEPGEDYGYTANTNVASIATYITNLSTAIKDIDPAIKVIGPSHEWYNKGANESIYDGIYDELFSGTGTGNDISGLISSTGSSNGKAIIDFMSVNQYAYMNVPSTSDTIYTQLEKIQKDPYNSKKFRGVLKEMRDKCVTFNASSTLRPGQPMGYIITEANIIHNNSSSFSASFLAGQMWARMLALAMEYECSSVMFFSVSEGCSSASDRGYLDGCSPYGARPSYYHYKQMAKWFNGMYLKDMVLHAKLTATSTNSIEATSNANYFSNIDMTNTSGVMESDFRTVAFANLGTNIAVMILNRSSSAVSFTYRLDGSTTFTGTPQAQKFSFNAGISSSNPNVQQDFLNMAANSSMVLVHRCDGTLLEKWVSSGTSDFAQTIITTPGPVTFTGSVTTTPKCVNDNTASITVTSVSGATYRWYKLPSTSSYQNSGAISSNLACGAYQTTILGTNVCPTPTSPSGLPATSVSVINVVHQKSPLVDAGPDKSITSCPGSVTVGVTNLPTSQTYSWAPAGGTNTTATATSGGQYIITASGGGCLLSDDAMVTNTSLSVNGGPDKTAPGCCAATMTATATPSTGTTYVWYDPSGTVIATTSSCTSTPNFYGTYKVVATNGSCTAHDYVNVTAGGISCCRMANPDSTTNTALPTPSLLLSSVPNPASDKTSVFYTLSETAVKAELVITNIFGQVVGTYPVYHEKTFVDVDCSKLPSGIYFNTLVVDGQLSASSKFMIIK